MSKQHNWIIQLCDYHAVKFSASFYNFDVIRDAIKTKGSCISCKLDIPANIKKVDVILEDDGDY